MKESRRKYDCKRKGEFLFRPLKISDMRFLAEYGAECEGMSESSDISQIALRLKQRFNESNYIGVIVLHGNDRIGFVDGIIVEQNLKLNEIYVKKKYRSRNIGKRLIEVIISIGKSRDVRRVTFHTETDNIEIQALGKNLGFELKGTTYKKKLTD
jgi:ribosomal protein S18 acetylase RimI-like enzyme